VAILVKRYSNRRLYDTEKSRYITIEELASRLRAGEDFQVVDSDTGKDLTKRILLQVVLLDSMDDLVEALPLNFLKTLIRLRDKTMRDLFIRHLRMNVEVFAAAQRQIEDNLRLVQEQMAATTHLMRSVLPFARRPDRATEAEGTDGDSSVLEAGPGGGSVPERGRDEGSKTRRKRLGRRSRKK